MPRRVTVSLLAVQLVVACGYAVSAEEAGRPSFARSSAVVRAEKPAEELTLRLTARFLSAPGYLRSLIRVSPNDRNRLLRVEIDSAEYYRSSEIQLDGASAPMSHWVDWKDVPAGKYSLVVSVLGASGERRATRQADFQVLGMSNEP
jgi:hypothetical protein